MVANKILKLAQWAQDESQELVSNGFNPQSGSGFSKTWVARCLEGRTSVEKIEKALVALVESGALEQHQPGIYRIAKHDVPSMSVELVSRTARSETRRKVMLRTYAWAQVQVAERGCIRVNGSKYRQRFTGETLRTDLWHPTIVLNGVSRSLEEAAVVLDSYAEKIIIVNNKVWFKV